jgi:hypothetical protein
MGRHGFSQSVVERGKRARDGGGEIVLIEGELAENARRSLARDCTAAMARLEQARIGWQQFERQDKPAFVRWRAREFGALLSTARDVEDRIRDAQTIIHEVEMEMRRRIQDPYTAYQRVVFRRSGVGATNDPGDQNSQADSDGADTGGATAGHARKLSEFEQEALFQDWVQKFLGTNPDKMDDDAYTTTFEVFKSHMFGANRPGAATPTSDSKTESAEQQKRRARPVREDDEAAEKSSDTGKVDPRVKELYRRLVRRLHPDSRGAGADRSAPVSGLWHEVQEAYAASDVARMELLLALSDLADDLGAGTTVSEMQSVLVELDRSVRALEKSILEAEQEDAWNFARTGPSDELRMRVERQLKHQLATRAERLDLLSRTIADWARGPAANPMVRPVVSRRFARH